MTPDTTPHQRQGRIDPSVEAAPAEGWRRWASEIGSNDPQRIASAGGIIAAGFVMGVVVLYAFGWLAEEVMGQQTTAMDSTGYALIHRLSSPTMDTLARALSFMGSEGVLILAVVLLGVFLWQRRWGAAVILVLVSAGAQVLNDVLKTTFHRTRPEPLLGAIPAQQWSFPSGHAMVSIAFYFYLAYLCWRLVHGVWRVVLVVGLALLVVLIGVSRIYLQAHYVSDVLAGYLVGFLWADAVIIASQMLATRPLPRLWPLGPSRGGRSQPAHTLKG